MKIEQKIRSINEQLNPTKEEQNAFQRILSTNCFDPNASYIINSEVGYILPEVRCRNCEKLRSKEKSRKTTFHKLEMGTIKKKVSWDKYNYFYCGVDKSEIIDYNARIFCDDYVRRK